MDFLNYWDTRIDANERFFNNYPHIANFAFSECQELWDRMSADYAALLARHNALKEAASRSLDDAYNSFGDREEAHERLIDVAKLVVKSWNTVELGALKDAIEDMAALVGEE